MKYTLTINELIDRPIIRNDQFHEMYNKMTDDEIIQSKNEMYQMIADSGIEKKYPEWNVAVLSTSIDREILYDLRKEAWKQES